MTYFINTELRNSFEEIFDRKLKNEELENISWSSSYYDKVSEELIFFVKNHLKKYNPKLERWWMHRTYRKGNSDEITGLGYKTIERALPKDKKGKAIEEFIELLGYYCFKENWGAEKLKTEDLESSETDHIINLSESTDEINSKDVSSFQSISHEVLKGQLQKDFIIELNKDVRGQSGITRRFSFYLFSRSIEYKIAWAIDTYFQDVKVSLDQVDSLLTKQRDCLINKAGIVTNVGFKEDASKFGILNGLYMVVIPSIDETTFVSRLKETSIPTNRLYYILKSDEQLPKEDMPAILKTRLLKKYFNLESINELDHEISIEILSL